MKLKVIKTVFIFLFSITGFSLFNEVKCQSNNPNWYIMNAPFKMEEVMIPEFQNKDFSIKDYGGINDGHTLNTDAFTKAITACAAAGGGRVIVPKGNWLTGPIELKSNVNLHLESGAIIQFTKDHTQYPMITASSKSNRIVTASPIYSYDLKNIAITGEGIIDGAGDSWRPVKKAKTTTSQWEDLVNSGGVVSADGSIWWPSVEAMKGEEYLKKLKKENRKLTAEDYLPARDYLRPYMLYLINCKNILIKNVTIRNSPKFVFYPNSCTGLTMNHVNIFNDWWAQNGDGIDISRCKNVLIYDCTVNARDDGICMKSSGGENSTDGFNLENIIIAQCIVYRAHGGFVIGSNTDGGMQNIFVDNCHFIGTNVGIRVKSNLGIGGNVKNIFVKNILMNDIRNEAILFDTHYKDAPAGSIRKNTINEESDKVPLFTDFYFDSISCKGAKTAISITGLPQMPVTNIHFKNMNITSDKGFIATDASDIYLDNVKIIPEHGPVYRLYHVKNITINKGYFPLASAIFYKADSKTTGVNITETDLRK
ncbi:MAG TPA: glycoside hydrolase family 28 protein [Hanamia sp.]|nr:glycoside hydrolase family 28 protein [Hanamia sp.]